MNKIMVYGAKCGGRVISAVLTIDDRLDGKLVEGIPHSYYFGTRVYFDHVTMTYRASSSRMFYPRSEMDRRVFKEISSTFELVLSTDRATSGIGYATLPEIVQAFE